MTSYEPPSSPRCYPTPPLIDKSIRHYTDDEYLQIIHSLSETCWRHYESSGSHSSHSRSKRRRHYSSLYIGHLGPCAYLRLRLYDHLTKTTTRNTNKPLTNDNNDNTIFNPTTLLQNALQSTTDTIKHSQHPSRRCTLLEGPYAGALALQSTILHRMTNHHHESTQTAQALLSHLSHSLPTLSSDECEILYGRAGMLSAILFVRWGLSDPRFGSDLARTIARDILKEGCDLGRRREDVGLSLLWQWHDKAYLGAAHGVVGILQTLLCFADEMEEWDRRLQNVKDDTTSSINLLKMTIDKLDNFCSSSSGNLRSSISRERDELVHWCHGAPGHVLLLVKASHVFNDESYLTKAEDLARRVVFTRGLLRKGVGLCHGIAGNAYVFLSLHRARMRRSGEGYKGEWLRMARHFADFAIDGYKELEDVPDRPYSLFEGSAGLVVLLIDLLHPESSGFPCYEY